MNIKLFDVQTGFGGAIPGQREVVAATKLAADMRRLEIAGALVRITPEKLDFDVELSNARLRRACLKHRGFVPCPVLVPSSGGDFPPEENQVDRCVKAGAGAVFLRPGPDEWALAEWSGGRLFRALAERRMPVFCLNRLFPLEQIATLAERYPSLPVLLAEVGYRQQRLLLALLEAYTNIYLSIGNRFASCGGLRQLVARVGADRLLFGTGYPESEPAAAVAYLMYADISSEEKALIGAGNMRRLMKEIR